MDDDPSADLSVPSLDLHKIHLLAEHPELSYLYAADAVPLDGSSLAEAHGDHQVALQSKTIILDLLHGGQDTRQSDPAVRKAATLQAAKQQLALERRARFRKAKMDALTTKRKAADRPSPTLKPDDIAKYVQLDAGDTTAADMERARAELQVQMKHKLEAEAAALRAFEADMERKKTAEEQSSALKRKEEENAQLRSRIVQRVDQFVQLRRNRLLHGSFYAWHQYVCSLRTALSKHQIARDWRCQLWAWSTWRKQRQRRVQQREDAEITRQLKHQQVIQARADRFCRSRRLSQTFLQWTLWVQAERDAREMRKQHQQRREHVKEFLARLDEHEPPDTVTSKPAEAAKPAIKSLTMKPVNLIHPPRKIQVDEKFVKSMQEREEARRKRRDELAAARQLKEDQAAKAAEEARQQAVAQEEQKRAEEAERKAQERRRVKLEAERKRATQELQLRKQRVVERFRERAQLKFYGLLPWISRAQGDRAASHYTAKVCRAVLRQWSAEARQLRMQQLEHDRLLQIKADAYARRYLPKVYFRLWRQYVANERENRWKEYKRTVMRNKVKNWLSTSTLEQALEHTHLSTPNLLPESDGRSL
ncbi:hypothetical protein RI367_004756 [Sorochytrium milnesiophthora]